MIREANGVIRIRSQGASLEANYALKKLVGDENFSTGLCVSDQAGIDLALDILRNGPARTPSLAEVEQADVIVLLGIDPTNEAPMLDFAIRQAMRKAPLDIARKLAIPDWDANAVATALQGAKGKLYIATPWAIKLEEISLEAHHASPPNIAAFATGIAEYISSRGATCHAELDSASALRPGQTLKQVQGDSMADRAAVDLREAHQPLIVTTISAGPNVIKAAANLASALCSQGGKCWLTIAVPEANTMGVGMLGGMSVQALSRVNSGRPTRSCARKRPRPPHRPRAFQAAMAGVKHLIALDCIETATARGRSRASYARLPSGTFINNEARAAF